MKNLRDQDYYELLEVSSEAPQHEIRKAYERVKMTYSKQNDALFSVFTEEEAGELLKLIEEAFSVLGNSKLRRSYDQKIMSLGRNHQAPPGFINPVAPAPVAVAAPSSVEVPNPVFTSREILASEGVGRTSMGTYVIEEEFEQVIASREIFDGPFLRKVREYRQVTIQQLAQLTRIGSAYLRAIEENDFVSLPAPVFVRGFVVQYSKALKLNPEKVAKSFMKIFKDSLGK